MKKPIYIKMAFFLFITCLLVSCYDRGSEQVTVAKIGREKISRSEFKESFALNPQYAIRTSLRKAMESQLNFLVQQSYYYLAARKVQLEADSVVNRRLQYIKDQEMIKAYLKKNFLDQTVLSDAELLQGMARLDRQVRVQHLFAPSLAECESLYNRLTGGESFEKLAAEIYQDSSLQHSGGDLGYVGFGDIDAGLENVVFSLQPGEVSPPVPSAYGYHILRVIDNRQNTQLMTLGETNRIQLVNDILRARKADQKIRAHLAELAQNQQIQVNNRILDVLVNATQQVMGNRYQEASLLIPPIKTGDLLQLRAGLQDISGQKLAGFGEMEMTVANFLERLKEMPPLHRPYLRTRSRMAQSIIDMFRNDLLLKEARQQRIDQDPRFREEYQKYTRELLAAEFQKRYYSQNRDHRWDNYHLTLEWVKDKNNLQIYPDRLYENIGDPDSTYAPDPIPVFVKSRYIW